MEPPIINEYSFFQNRKHYNFLFYQSYLLYYPIYKYLLNIHCVLNLKYNTNILRNHFLFHLLLIHFFELILLFHFLSFSIFFYFLPSFIYIFLSNIFFSTFYKNISFMEMYIFTNKSFIFS